MIAEATPQPTSSGTRKIRTTLIIEPEGEMAGTHAATWPCLERRRSQCRGDGVPAPSQEAGHLRQAARWGAKTRSDALPFLELHGYVLQRGLPQLLLALDK
jgi:hypothetical protein